MAQAESDTKLVKKRELAAILGVSARTVDSWVAKRIIPHLAITPRLHLFDPAAVRTALQNRFEVQARQPGLV